MSIINEKNVTPNKLALLSAFSISALVLFVFLLTASNYLFISIACGIIFICSYGIIFITIEKFFYRKIKLLYKFISQTKAGVKEEALREIVMPHITIDQVSEDVMTWADEQKVNIENLEKNEQYRKEFLMNFAHEIKTPIFTVQGYLHTLKDGAINDLNVRDKFIANAIKGIDRLSSLAASIDEITKFEKGDLSLNKEKFIVQDLIQDVFQEFSLDAEKMNLGLNIKDGYETPVMVLADKQKIKQVLVNLINNAIRYSKQGGFVNASIYTIDSENVYVEITDDGIGIDKEFVPRIFERFFRTDSGRNRNAGGSGLGLAIVKHIIEAHGHTVTCRSALGVGSSFGFGIDKG
jgi:two-component system, OmpR family, phosphate regulon sensor histidine kinase PhoR